MTRFTLLFLLLAALLSVTPVLGQNFECGGVFERDTDRARLAEYFDVDLLVDTAIDVGEGIHKPGTIVEVGDQVIAVLWTEPGTYSGIDRVYLRGGPGNWSTPSGISIGSSLKEIEAINRYPFRLAGFAWDYGGTVTSWGRGDLAHDRQRCRTGIRLAPESAPESEDRRRAYRQVMGDRIFSSGHPAMQLLNPRVYEIILLFE